MIIQLLTWSSYLIQPHQTIQSCIPFLLGPYLSAKFSNGLADFTNEVEYLPVDFSRKTQFGMKIYNKYVLDQQLFVGVHWQSFGGVVIELLFVAAKLFHLQSYLVRDRFQLMFVGWATFATLFYKDMVQPIPQPQSSHTNHSQYSIMPLVRLAYPFSQFRMINPKIERRYACLRLVRVQVYEGLVLFFGHEGSRARGGNDPCLLFEAEPFTNFKTR